MASERLSAGAERWVETVAFPSYAKAARQRANRAAIPRAWLAEFLKTDAAIPFAHDDTDEWTRNRLGDYLNRLAYENMKPAEAVDTGEPNDYPYTG